MLLSNWISAIKLLSFLFYFMYYLFWCFTNASFVLGMRGSSLAGTVAYSNVHYITLKTIYSIAKV